MRSASPATLRRAFDGLGVGGNPQIVNLEDAITCHQLALSAAGRSPKTCRLYLLYENRFLEYLRSRGLPLALDQINPVNVRQAVMWFQQRHIGARRGEVATAMFLKVLKMWSNFLEQEGVFSSSPLHKVRPMHTRQLERQPYTRAEVNAMLHSCDVSRQPERDKLLVLLLLDSGARAAEIANLRVSDVRPAVPIHAAAVASLATPCPCSPHRTPPSLCSPRPARPYLTLPCRAAPRLTAPRILLLLCRSSEQEHDLFVQAALVAFGQRFQLRVKVRR